MARLSFRVFVIAVAVTALGWFAGSAQAACAGNYSASCTNETLTLSRLKGYCETYEGDYVSTSIDLNVHITNSNGVLMCISGFGLYAASCAHSKLLEDGHTFTANCKNTSSFYLPASLDLDECISNINGTFTWTCLRDTSTLDLLSTM